jgi:membrane associated rhomboid family serine protease
MANNHFFAGLNVPLRLVFLMWGFFFLEGYFEIDLGVFGIWPRRIFGLIGIFTAPMLHGNLVHLVSNTLPLLFLGMTLFYFYDKVARQVFFHCYFTTGFLVWVFARPNIHIGASGLIYGIASFLVFFGVFRKDFKSLIISAIIIFVYGSMVYGVFPTQPGVSWESHLLGAIVGAVTASSMAKKKNVSSF